MSPKYLLTVAALGLSLAACTPTATETTTQVIKLTAKDMLYAPTQIEVVAGQPVRLTFTNNDVLEHDLSILEIEVKDVTMTGSHLHEGEGGHMMTVEPDLHMALAPDKTGVLEFTPLTPGTYEFFCTVAGHKESGMVGTLVVKQP